MCPGLGRLSLHRGSCSVHGWLQTINKASPAPPATGVCASLMGLLGFLCLISAACETSAGAGGVGSREGSSLAPLWLSSTFPPTITPQAVCPGVSVGSWGAPSRAAFPSHPAETCPAPAADASDSTRPARGFPSGKAEIPCKRRSLLPRWVDI